MFSELDLFEYQPPAIEQVSKKPAFGLLVDMGLGKTVIEQTAFLDRIARRKRKGLKTRGVLVIGPKRVCETVWEQEQIDWPHLRGLRFVHILGGAAKRKRALYEKGDVYLINVDNVAWLAVELYAMQQSGRDLPFDWLVVDESSMFKDPSTKRFRALRAILPCFRKRNILTGTPTPKVRKGRP